MVKREHMTEKTDAELGTLLADMRKELRGVRFEAAGARAKDASAAAKLRKTVARILTEQNARTSATRTTL